MSSTVTAPTTDASLLTAGLIPAGRLASGTADGTTFPRGDRTWAVPAGGGGGGDPTTGAANRFLATPDGSSGTVTLRAIVAADVPDLATSKITGLDTALAAKLAAASNLSDLASAATARTNLGLGTAATSPSTAFAAASHTHSPSDLTASVPVAKGGTGLTAITSGRLIYASAANTFAELSIGSGLSISSGTLSATGGGGGSGTVTSVAMTVPTGELAVSGSPVTSSGTLALTWATQTTGKVLAAPNGSTGAPTFRTLAAADIPSLAASKITSGTIDVARLPTGIDAASVGGGSVSNTEFGYLDGVTSGIQGQIDALSGGGGGGGGSYLPLSGGTMSGSIDMGTYYAISNAASITSNGSLIATGYTSFFGDGINFGWLPGYTAGEFQSLSGGAPAPMFFDSSELRFRGDGYAALATLNGDGLDVPAPIEATAFIGPGTCPTGCVVPYLGPYAPTGWLICDGSDVSRYTYADLFAVIGTTYGVGDGSSTFGLPALATAGPGSTPYIIKT